MILDPSALLMRTHSRLSHPYTFPNASKPHHMPLKSKKDQWEAVTQNVALNAFSDALELMVSAQLPRSELAIREPDGRTHAVSGHSAASLVCLQLCLWTPWACFHPITRSRRQIGRSQIPTVVPL